MPENKKDSFTFSDKIKNSKPAFNPFSKRASSKIGSNGKPKKTLFERTKRDAPFFVAAAAALLMLPFLYKYSGSMNEEPIIPPGSEDTIFDPERFGYEPSVEDPNGQIAQLTGRDPFSLIKGWGSDDETEDEALPPYEDFSNRDGLEDTYTPPASNDYRQSVPPATRAAFQRQATKINELGSASMTRASGGGAGFGRFGGANLKAAAKEDSSGGPRQGTKPVSLQPLRAADSPSRSYFGQSGAAQARASRDALSKANAAQALRDAMFNPVETGRIGGIGTGEFGPGGGAGKIEHVLDYKGITPWWWDMMKERSQKAWEWKYFLWRKNLVEPLIRALAEDLIKLGRCIVWGNADGDMDYFLGGAPGEAKEGECNGISSKDWKDRVEEARKNGQLFPFGSFPTSEDKCRRALGLADNVAVKFSKPSPSVGGKGFFGSRLSCLGFVMKGRYGAGDPDLGLGGDGTCDALNRTQNYSVVPQGEALKWHTYHYIVARNYVPVQAGGRTRRIHLCNEWGNNLKWSEMSASAVSAAADLSIEESLELQKAELEINEVRAQRDEAAQRGEDTKNLDNRIKAYEDSLAKYEAKYAAKKKGAANNNNRKHVGGVEAEDLNDACVIYVAEAEVLNWEKGFKPNTIDMLTQLIVRQGLAADEVPEGSSISPARKMAEEAFNNLDLAFIEAITSKYPVNFKVRDLPMPYWQWFEANVERRGSKANVDKRKHRMEGIDTLRGQRCYFDNSVKLTCADTYEGESSLARALVTFGSSFKGGQQTGSAKDIKVTASYVPNSKGAASVLKEQEVKGTPTETGDISYLYDRILVTDDKGVSSKEIPGPGTVYWRLYRGGDLIQTRTCEYKNEGTTGQTPEPLVKEVEKTVYKYTDRTMNVASLATSMDQIPVDPKKHAVTLRADGSKPTPASGDMVYAASNFKEHDLEALNNAALTSDTALQFINTVVDKYNTTLRQENEPFLNPIVSGSPRLSEFVDSLYMAKNSLGMTEVARSAVCEMGRAIALRSRDVSDGGSRAQGLTNTFGTFAIYTGLSSVYFPNKKVQVDGDEITDPRFASDPYYWGNYADRTTSSTGGVYPSVKEAISQAMVNDKFPLASMVKDFPELDTEHLTEEVGVYRDRYSKTYGVKLFAGFGQCSTLQGDMPIQDALDYMGRVIELGLEYKPQAVASSGANKSHTSYAGAARSGQKNQ